MFDDFQLDGLSIEDLAGQVVGLLNNPFVVAAIVAVLALFFARTIALTLLGITGLGHALRQVRWTATNRAGEMRSHGEDDGDVEFWHDKEVTQGHVRPVGFRRTPAYRKSRRNGG